MTDTTKIINITVTRDDFNITQEGFGTPLVLAPHVSWTDYTRQYSNLNEVGEDFADDSKVYQWALKIFSQSPRPPVLKVGRRQVDTIDIEIKNVVANTEYKTIINGTAFTFPSGATPTNLTIAAGLVAAINGGTEPVTAVDNTDGTYTLNADTSGVAFSAVVDVNQEINQAFTPLNDIVVDVQKIQENDNDWYAIDELEYAEQTDLAAYIETQEKIYAVFTDDPNVINQNKATDTTSIAALLHAGNYDRSFVVYTGQSSPSDPTAPNAKYIEAALLGKQLPTDPGSTTWANKNLAGVPADNLNSTQYDNALSKKCNVYTLFGGRGFTRDGTVASGEYIDVIRGIDWFVARLRERLLTLLAESPKIPYTDHGVALLESQLRAQIQDGIAAGLIDDDINTYYVTTKLVKDVDQVDRENRIYRHLEWQWRAAGAIHNLVVTGRVTF